MAYIRVLIAVVVINGVLNEFLRAFVWDSFYVVLATGIWIGLGYGRVFNGSPKADSFLNAFRGVLMSVLWPLVPPRTPQ